MASASWSILSVHVRDCVRSHPLLCAAWGEDLKYFPAEPGSKPSWHVVIFCAPNTLPAALPSLHSRCLSWSADKWVSLSVCKLLAFRWEPALGDPASERLLSVGTQVMESLSIHSELCVSLWCWSTALPSQSVAAGALQESAVPMGWLFQSGSLGLVESPREWILWCPAAAEAPAETVTGFFYPNASFSSCNLKPGVTSSPILIFPTNFGWVCLYKQINCFEGSLLLCILFQTLCAGAVGKGTGNLSGSWWRAKLRSELSVGDTISW